MPKSARVVSPLRLIKWCSQWQEKKDYVRVPLNLRGIYVLYKREGQTGTYNVMYVGMAASGTGIKRRLRSHSRSKRKGGKWSHFSFFVVWENIRNDEINELEALFREIYRKDAYANSLAIQKGSKRIREVRWQSPNTWSKR